MRAIPIPTAVPVFDPQGCRIERERRPVGPHHTAGRAERVRVGARFAIRFEVLVLVLVSAPLLPVEVAMADS
jgi:hypothetical protein